MATECKLLGGLDSLGAIDEFDRQLMSVFSGTSEIGLAIFDTQQRFRFVNNAMVAIHHNSGPAEAFVGRTVRDIVGEAAPEPEARLQRVLIAGETPALEVSMMLPARIEPGYWIVKNFTIRNAAGRVTQVASLAIEVTAQRKLEDHFRKLCGELLGTKEDYQRLARELHNSINEYHAALGMSLDHLSRCTKTPERIPELMAQSMDCLDNPMRKLTSAVAKCFPLQEQ